MQLAAGRVYRAKKPLPAGNAAAAYFNDRKIVWMDETTVQYSSPSVTHGRPCPAMDRKAFEEWACRDVTDQLSDGKWQKWGDAE